MVLLDDRVDHGETEAVAVLLCGDERIEDSGLQVLWDSLAGVGHSQLEMAVAYLRREDESTSLGHGVGGILDKVDEDLAELIRVGL